MSQRDLSLDYIKGVLIFLVVYGHCLYWLDGNNNTELYYFVPYVIYSFHMPLFIFLSGYFFSKSLENDFLKIISKRFKRLIVPHFFFNIIMIIPICCFWEQYGHFITRRSNGVVSLTSIYHYITMFWYLWCVFFSSIITQIIYILSKKRIKVFYFFLFFVSCLFTTISSFSTIGFFFEHQNMGTMFLYFSIGIIISQRLEIMKIKLIKYTAIIIFLFHLSCYFIPINTPKSFTEFTKLASLVCMYNLFIFLYQKKIGIKFFTYLSKWSLGIYIYHFVILYGMMRYFNNIFEHYGIHLIYINLILSLLVTYVTAIIVNFIHKYKLFRIYALGEI